jgi:hypothetical protein
MSKAPTSDNKHPTLPVASNFSFKKMEANMALERNSQSEGENKGRDAYEHY